MKTNEFLDTLDLSKYVKSKKVDVQEVMGSICYKYDDDVNDDPDLEGDVFNTMSTAGFEEYLTARYPECKGKLC